MVAELLIAFHLCAHDLVREEVGRVDGVFFGMVWSVLEDEIEQFVGGSVFDNICGDFVRLEDNPGR